MAPIKEPEKFEYDVVTSFWDGPHLRVPGKDTVWMTEDQARYFVPHILVKKDNTDTPAKGAGTAASKKK